MPAPMPSRPVPMHTVRLFVRHLIATLAPDMGDGCIVWAGPYADKLRTHPTIKGADNTQLSVRALLCHGDPKLPVVMSCSTPGCINPRHMRRVSTARPAEIGQVKLPRHGDHGPHDYARKTTSEMRAKILEALSGGQSQLEVGRAFGVSQSTISRIARTA